MWLLCQEREHFPDQTLKGKLFSSFTAVDGTERMQKIDQILSSSMHVKYCSNLCTKFWMQNFGRQKIGC